MSERDQREFASRVLTPAWEQSLRDRLDSGLISPTIEGKLLDYKYGKPVERREIVVRGTLEGMPLEELLARSQRVNYLLEKLLEQKKQEETKLLEAGDVVEVEAIEVKEGVGS